MDIKKTGFVHKKCQKRSDLTNVTSFSMDERIQAAATVDEKDNRSSRRPPVDPSFASQNRKPRKCDESVAM